MLEKGHLRIYGHGEVEVELITAYLAELRRAYESILVFEVIIDSMERVSHEFPFGRYPFLFSPDWTFYSRRGMRRVQGWPPAADEIASFVPATEQLILSAVKIASPGFWEFLGKINPLEVLRQYLSDRHERRKDREYRESAEQRRLVLENLERENRVLSERIMLARKLGATDSELAPLLNVFIRKPLTSLDRFQDRGVIEKASLFWGKDEF